MQAGPIGTSSLLHQQPVSTNQHRLTIAHESASNAANQTQPPGPAAAAASEPLGMPYLTAILEVYSEYTRSQLWSLFQDRFTAENKLPELQSLIKQVIPVDGDHYVGPPWDLATPPSQLLVQNADSTRASVQHCSSWSSYVSVAGLCLTTSTTCKASFQHAPSQANAAVKRCTVPKVQTTASKSALCTYVDPCMSCRQQTRQPSRRLSASSSQVI